MSPGPRISSRALAAVAAIALFVAAGNWQRARMNAKEAERARGRRGRRAIAPVPLPDASDWSAWRWRRVVATGTWRGAAQLLVDNRIVDGRAGFAVVTPLALDDGAPCSSTAAGRRRAPARRACLASTRRRDAPRVEGRVVVPPARYVELGAPAAPSGNVWQNLDPRASRRRPGSSCCRS
jgi:surfeit locus 1 family protein